MSAIKVGLEFVTSPMGILILSAGAGLGLLAFPRRRKLARQLLTFGCALFLLFTLTPLAEVALTLLERQNQLVSRSDFNAIKWVVVLAGFGRERLGIPITSSLSDDTLCRVAEGVRLYRLAPGAKIIVSGGPSNQGQRPVSAMMADLMIVLGVSADDILIEERATTTFENLVNVERLVAGQRFLLVAPARDLPRAMGVARQLGMAATPAPACIRTLQSYPVGMTGTEWLWTVLDSLRYPSFQRLVDLQSAHHEYLGYLWYRLLGRI